MGLLSFENWIPLADGVTEICFRTPERTELEWAVDAMARITTLDQGSAEMKALVMEEIPAKLAELLTNIKLPGGKTPPPTWKEEIAGSTLFVHNDGITLVNKVFFRTQLQADKPSPAGSK